MPPPPPKGPRRMLAPGVSKLPGVAPMGVRKPARRAAMFCCASRRTSGSRVRKAYIRAATVSSFHCCTGTIGAYMGLEVRRTAAGAVDKPDAHDHVRANVETDARGGVSGEHGGMCEDDHMQLKYRHNPHTGHRHRGEQQAACRAWSHSSLDCSLGMSGKKSRSMMLSSASAHSSSSRTSGFHRGASAGARGGGGAMKRCRTLPAGLLAAAVRLAMVCDTRRQGRGPPGWGPSRRGIPPRRDACSWPTQRFSG